MNEDNLNMEIRKFLKKVGITSQRIIENLIYEADKNGTIKIGDEIELNMTLSIKNFQSSNRIDGKITINKILSFPDIITNTSSNSNLSYKRILTKCLNEAIYDLIQMRKKEGENLTCDIHLRLNKIKKYYKKWYRIEERKNIMSQRYSGKSRKDSSTMKKSKLSLLEKRKIKREKKKKR